MIEVFEFYEIIIFDSLINDYIKQLCEEIFLHETFLLDSINSGPGELSSPELIIKFEPLSIIPQEIEIINCIQSTESNIILDSILNKTFSNYEKNNLTKQLLENFFIDFCLNDPFINEIQINDFFENDLWELHKLCQEKSTIFLQYHDLFETLNKQIQENSTNKNSGLHIYRGHYFNNNYCPILLSTVCKSLKLTYDMYYDTDSDVRTKAKSAWEEARETGAGAGVDRNSWTENKNLVGELFKCDDFGRRKWKLPRTKTFTHLGYHIQHEDKVLVTFFTSHLKFPNIDLETNNQLINNFDISSKLINNFNENIKGVGCIKYANKVMIMEATKFYQYIEIFNNPSILPKSFLNQSEDVVFNDAIKTFKKVLMSQYAIRFKPIPGKYSKKNEDGTGTDFCLLEKIKLLDDIDSSTLAQILDKLDDEKYLISSYNNFFKNNWEIYKNEEDPEIYRNFLKQKIRDL